MAHGRKRTICGWSCLSASVLFAAILLASSRYSFDLSWTPGLVGQDATYCLSVQRGFIVAGRFDPSQNSGDLEIRRAQDFDLEWWFSIQGISDHGAESRGFGLARTLSNFGRIIFSGIFILIWPLALLSLAGGLPILLSGRRAARRARAGHCACGYDRTATPPGAPCPECGTTKTA